MKVQYGINASSYKEGASDLTDLFFGFTFGIGCEIRFGKYKSNGINVDLNFPVGNKELDKLMRHPQIEINYEPFPFTISVGYHFEF